MNVFRKFLVASLSVPKTIYLNFKYFPIRIAIKFPMLVSHRVIIKSATGKIVIRGKVSSGMIVIGFYSVASSSLWERSLWNVEGQIVFGGRAVFGAGSRIAVTKAGKLTLGKNFYITARSEIICTNKITLGDDCLVSWDVLVMDTDAHPIRNQAGEIINYPKEITVGNNCWLGCRSILLKGARLESDVIVGSNTLINKKYNEKEVVIAGNPGKIVKTNIKWLREHY